MIRFLAEAQRDLDDAFQYYETARPGLGLEFLDTLDGAIRRLARFPDSGSTMTPALRRVLLPRYPYGIIYGCDGDTLVVVAVAHLHRRPRYWTGRK